MAAPSTIGNIYKLFHFDAGCVVGLIDVVTDAAVVVCGVSTVKYIKPYYYFIFLMIYLQTRVRVTSVRHVQTCILTCFAQNNAISCIHPVQ